MNAYAYSDDAMTHPAGASESNSRAVAEAVGETAASVVGAPQPCLLQPRTLAVREFGSVAVLVRCMHSERQRVVALAVWLAEGAAVLDEEGVAVGDERQRRFQRRDANARGGVPEARAE